MKLNQTYPLMDLLDALTAASDERDVKVYNGWRRNRRKRGIDPDWPTPEERSRYFEGRDGV